MRFALTMVTVALLVLVACASGAASPTPKPTAALLESLPPSLTPSSSSQFSQGDGSLPPLENAQELDESVEETSRTLSGQPGDLTDELETIESRQVELVEPSRSDPSIAEDSESLRRNSICAIDDEIPPTVEITSPTEELIPLWGSTITISAVAEDGQEFIAWIEFAINGVNLGAYDSDEAGMGIDYLVPDGIGFLAIGATASDACTNTGTATMRLGVLQVLPPTIEPITPTPEVLEEYRNAEFGYSIKFPPSWRTIETSPDTLFATNPNSSAISSVFVLNNRVEKSLHASADDWMVRKETKAGSVQRSDVVISGQSALRVSYIRTGPVCDEQENVVFVTDVENRLFMLIGTDCEGEADLSQGTIQAIQNSFTLSE